MGPAPHDVLGTVSASLGLFPFFASVLPDQPCGGWSRSPNGQLRSPHRTEDLRPALCTVSLVWGVLVGIPFLDSGAWSVPRGLFLPGGETGPTSLGVRTWPEVALPAHLQEWPRAHGCSGGVKSLIHSNRALPVPSRKVVWFVRSQNGTPAHFLFPKNKPMLQK